MRANFMKKIILLASVALSVSAASAYGQTQQTGLPQFGSLESSSFDAINHQNLNVGFSIPIVSNPGRGMPYSFGITYNSLIWVLNGSGSTWTWQLLGSGWNYKSLTGQTSYSFTWDMDCYLGTREDIYSNYSYTESNGTVHPFGIYVTVGANCNSGSRTGYATDASGFWIDATNLTQPIVYSPSGAKITTDGTIKDANGNYISTSIPVSGEMDLTDTTGQVILKEVTLTNEVDFQYQDTNGTWQTIQAKTQTYNIKTAFGCSVVEYTGSMALPYEIDFPNGQKYIFTYEASPGNSGYYTGRLQRATLPTGGYFEYDYTGANGGISCSDGTTLGMNRVVSDGTSTATWNFVRNTSNLTTTVTTPQLADTANANDTVYTFNTSGQEVARKIYANSPGSGSPLRTINTTWAANKTPATKVTILEDGSTQSETDTTFDSNGLLGSVSEYDFGAAPHGGFMRTTTLSYQNSTNYTSRNIINLVTSKIIQDRNGATQYRQDVAYDGTALANCPTGVLQHDDTNYGCGMNYRGNPTSVTTYLTPATPANGIGKSFAYDVFGNLLTAQLNCCQNKAWTYSATTQYSQPDSVIRGSSPTQLTTSATYNTYTGQVTTSTDENGQVTHYYYDLSRRLTSLQRPDGTTLTNTFDDSQFTITSRTPIDSSKALQQISAADGLGRAITSTIEDGANSVVSIVRRQYDLLGRAYKTSNPYTGSAQYWTTSQFDALGRPSNTSLPDGNQTTYSYATTTTTVTDPAGKQRASKSDAVGRMIEVDEPGIASGASPTPATGSVSISGTLQTIGGTPATGSAGSVSISGSEKSAQTAPATSGTGTVTIGGVERSKVINECPPHICNVRIYDTGSVSITVNAVGTSVSYGGGDTPSTIASALANAINANTNINSLVSASASSTTVTITARQTGSQTNYSLSAAAATSDPTDFPTGQSFTATPSGSALTGGNDAQIAYDSGTVSITVNGGSPASVSYNSASTPSSIASQLANALASSSLVNASASGNVISLTSKTTGAATNYSLSASSQSNNSSLFNPPSFGGTPSGSTMSGGSDGTATQYDSGTVWITVGGGAPTTVNYGQGSTPSSIASALASALTGSTVTATATNSTVNLTSVMTGSAANSITLAAGSATNQPGTFSQPSFQTAPSGATLTGGSDPTLSLSTPAITAYNYTVLDSLTSVTQGAQTRTYLYDALGRLTSASTPEAGTLCFGTVSGGACQSNGYDSFDNLLYKTDARGVVTNYSYDGLNRLYQTSYNVGSTGVPATPTVTLTYGTNSSQNNNGRLITMTDGVGSENYSYDNLGQITQLQKLISGTAYPISYAYNLAGEMIQIIYPSGRVVQQSFDAIGRLCEIAPSTSGCSTAASPYATAFGYNTASQVTGFNYGNGVGTAIGYSPDRLQMTALQYAKGGSTLFNLSYAYGSTGSNNGQISGITDSVDNGRTISYTYDALARLSTAVTTGSTNYPQWGLSMTYDRYGNRTAEIPTAGSGMPSNSVAVDAATNHINSGGYAYDAAGNMTNDGSNTLAYDAENRVVTATGGGGSGTYTYDGKGLRVTKVSGGMTTVYIFSGEKVIAEYDNAAAVGSPSREYIYSGSLKLAKIESSSTIYYHSDHLSSRVLTDLAGSTVAQRGHYSFGESWFETGTASKFKFTTYERDGESGNDYAMARYNVNRLGRFASPDPLAGSPSSPQSLNRYAYSANDPVNLVDPSGLFVAPQLYGLMHSIGASSFGSMWNEFDLFGLGNKASTTITQTLTANLIDYSCAGGACTGIVQYSLEIATAINFSSSLFLDPFGGGQAGGPQSDKIIGNRGVLKRFYCLWQAGGYGNLRTERSMWVTQDPKDNYGFVDWPWSATWGKESWKGPLPAGTVADAHIHPNAMNPKPSTSGGHTGRGDQGTADMMGLPVYVVTRDAIWKAVPGGKDPVQVAGSDWTKEFQKEHVKCP